MKLLYEFSDSHNDPYSISIVNRENYPQDRLNNTDLQVFFNIYQNTIKEYLEDVEKICSRLQENTDPATYLVICKDKNNEKVIGGYIFEYYPDSQVCLLPYIFLTPLYQNKQIGINLGASVQTLINTELIDFERKKVKAVFFDLALHPDFINIASYAPGSKFFSKIDGIWLDVPYMEPLSGEVDYLLGAIPASGNLRDNFTEHDLYAFFKELYSLNNNTILHSPFFKNQIIPLQKDPYWGRRKITDKIKEFPKLIQPRLKISRASIALHFVQETGIELDWEVLKKDNHIYDTVFNSYEKDLFSQRFADDPPYYSKHVDIKYATIQFGNIMSFNSEGRHETFIFVDEHGNPITNKHLKKRVKIFLNYTLFKKKDPGISSCDNILIWELVLSPVDYFNEYEFIQLEKYFTGKQESFHFDIKYVLHDRVYDDIFDFAEKLIGRNIVLRKEILAGTIQLDTSYLWYQSGNESTPTHHTDRENIMWSQIYQYYNSDFSNKKDINNADKLERIYSENEDFRYILNTFCGIALGIFDFDRMSIEEVNDTLIPLRSTDSYFVILNNGSIACFCNKNDIYANALKYGIGINPYFIILNAVLAYNGYLTVAVYDQAIQSENHHPVPLNPVLQPQKKYQNLISGFWNRKGSAKTNRLSELIYRKDHISSFLKNIVPNVYQYETEREIYSYGMGKRGINEKREALEMHKKELEEEISHLVNERANLLGKLSLVLGIISLSQIYQFFDAIKDIFTSNDTSPTKYISLIFTILSLVFFVYFYTKNYQIILVNKKQKRRTTT